MNLVIASRNCFGAYIVRGHGIVVCISIIALIQSGTKVVKKLATATPNVIHTKEERLPRLEDANRVESPHVSCVGVEIKVVTSFDDTLGM